MNREQNGQVLLETPAWLREGKLGIYTHWGVYSVHACGPNTTWYAHHLYRGGEKERAHFEAHFGAFGPHGYIDQIPRFTAERFDPDAWAELFQSAGARFAGPVAIHHDGFAMWRTRTTPFNSFAMGPKRDVTGELANAVRSKGMRFLTAFHHAENYWFLERMEGTDAVRPENAALFSKRGTMPYPAYCKLWLDQCQEVFDQYGPEILYFDFGLKEIPDAWKQEMLRRYLSAARQKGFDPAVCYKNRDLLPGAGLIDLEQGRFNDLRVHDWITDTTVDAGEAWGYMEGASYKSGAELVQYLADNVSKNGYLLLNVGPRADGTIPEEAQRSLRELGAWLRVNGEAVYGTHPWYAFGEGPTEMKTAGMFSERETMRYTPEDIRYTAREGCIYAIVLARPHGDIVLHEVTPNLLPGEVLSVSLLGWDAPLPFREEGNLLRVAFPDGAPDQAAYTLKIVRDPAPLAKWLP